MKFSFKIQQYQTDAVDAVARVFQGQPYNAGVSYLRDMGNLSAQPQQLSLVSSGDDATQVELQDLINDSGFKNEALQLTDQELLQNIRTLQAEANIHQSDKLVAPLGRCSLDIEMETGTGKTYVYIKTMFELNKRYGWSKFIVVVPSIAIREGVKKSFEITADHFMECYGKKARFFIYNSSNLNQLDSFSSNSGINVKSMFEDGNKPKVLENPLNDRFEKAEFQKLWQTINHKYAYTVEFDSEELIRKAIEHIDRELYVSRLQYTVTYAGQKDVLSADMVREGSSFSDAKSRTKKLEHDYAGQVAYDLIGKIAEGTTLTRHTVARILQGIKPTTFAMYQNNPEEFIAKVIRLVKEQKATMIVEHITYDTIEGSYDSSIFTAEKHALTMDKAYKAQKAIQDYVFTDGTAEKSVERKFAENLDGAEEVFIYAKLPKGFYIPTPVGHYSPDWAIVFHEGKVKHIYFVAETKGTMESLNLRPIEKSKIDCAKKLFAKLSDGLVTYDHVDSYQELMNKVLQ